MGDKPQEQSNVALPCLDKDGNVYGHAIFCPGCGQAHIFDKRWTYNDNPVKPTFRASMLVSWTYGPEHVQRCCHSFVTDGNIQFLNDCTHDLKGKTVPLEPFHW